VLQVKEVSILSNNDMASQRLKLIQKHLESELSPDSLKIVDESHLHVGHAGARDGKGHFKVVISTHQFKGRSLIERHKLVYGALASLMETDIHALSIETHIP